jgi:hypothetical protein
MQSAKLAQLLVAKGRQDQYAMDRLLDDPSAPDEVIGFHAQQTPFAVELRYDLLPVVDQAASPFDRKWAQRCVHRIVDWASTVVTPTQPKNDSASPP